MLPQDDQFVVESCSTKTWSDKNTKK